MDEPRTDSDPRSSLRSPLALAAGGAALAIVLDVALGTPSKGSDGLAFVGRFHPLAVHLPIGVILLLAALEGLSVSPRLRAKIDPAVATVLKLALLSAVAAFTMGLMLAHGGGYPAKLLRLHRMLTLATVIGTAGSVFAWSVVTERGASRMLYRGAIATTVGLLSIGAHFGGSMTHGDNYLVQYAPSFMKGLLGSTDQAAQDAPPPPSPPSNDPRVFADVVMPVLKEKCVECHGPEKTKAKLRLDSLDAIMKGGEDGVVVEAGHSEKSLLVTRIKKPTSDDEHMPPEDKTQITPEELDLLTFWIDRGASADLKVRDVLVPDGARGLLLKASTGMTTPAAPIGTTASTTKPDATVKPTPAPTVAVVDVHAPTTGGGLAFRDLVAPTLANKCGRCHGAEKQKGKLRTDSLAALLVGGKSGAAIVPNDPARGALMTRVHLPAADDKHMPPTDEQQLDAGELALLSFWIAHGASADLPASAVPASFRRVAPVVAHHAPTASPTTEPSTPPTVPTAPPTTTASAPAPIVRPVRLFTDVVRPIFEKRCGGCHAGEFASGDFIIADHDALFSKSRVVPGDIGASKLFGQISSPLSDEDHMPPKKKPQPSAEEIDAVRLWIARGAKEDLVVDASEVSPQLVGAIVAPPATTPSEAPAAAKLAAVKPRAGGCGSCAVTANDDRSASAVLGSSILLGALLARRKRVTRSSGSGSRRR